VLDCGAHRAHEPRDEREGQHAEADEARLREQVDEDVVRVVRDLDAAERARKRELVRREFAPADAEQRMLAEHREPVLPQRKARRNLARVAHALGRRFGEPQMEMHVGPAHRDVHRDERQRQHDRDQPRTAIARRTARLDPCHPETGDDHHRNLQPRPARHGQRKPGRQHDRQREPCPHREAAGLHQIKRAGERERDIGREVVRLRHVAVRPTVDRDVVHHDERRQRGLEMEQLDDLGRNREHSAHEQRARHHPGGGFGEPLARERVAGLHRDQRRGQIAERQPVHRRHLQRQQRDLREQHRAKPERRDECGRRRERSAGRPVRASSTTETPTSRYSTSAANSE
jgi:hypothetical protein